MSDNKDYIAELDKILKGRSLEEASEYILKMKEGVDRDELLIQLSDFLELQFFVTGSTHYGNRFDPEEINNQIIKLYLGLIDELPEDECYHRAVKAFIYNDDDKFFKYLDKYIKAQTELNTEYSRVSEYDIMRDFISPFLDAVPDLYPFLKKKLKGNYLDEMAEASIPLVEQYYACEDGEDRIMLLQDHILKYPDSMAARYLLLIEHYDAGLFNNVIAGYENIDMDEIVPGALPYLEFNVAWSYDKLRDYKNGEEHYRRCLLYDEFYPYARNNMGYDLIRQKKYEEAYPVFKDLIDHKAELPYAANNFVRCIIGLGKYKDAKAFISSSEFKIAKDIRERVKKLSNTNKGPSKNIKNPVLKGKIESFEYDIENPDDTGSAIDQKNSVKNAQFSNEKRLEDEIEDQIKSGIPVFGKKLRMYRRPGEYGRQYVIPIGRIDLLCEDDEGNLYVIELKKDSGYDDPYEQTVSYIDWVKKNGYAKGKKIFGIICLNNPSKKLIEKVRNDDRVKLFEYRIWFGEIK